MLPIKPVWKGFLKGLERGRDQRLLNLGARSKLVLMKLGFDLRSHYEDVLQEPVPDPLKPLIERLPADDGRDVIDVKSQPN